MRIKHSLALPQLAAMVLLVAGCDGLDVFDFKTPTRGESFTSPQTVHLEVSPTPFGQQLMTETGWGAIRIEFSHDGTLRCVDETAPFTCDWPVTSQDNGPHTWTANAFFPGYGSQQTSILLTVAIEPPIPTGEPRLIGFLPGLGSAQDIALDGGAAFVGSEAFGLSVVDDFGGAPRVTAGATEVFVGDQVAVRGTRAVATGVAADGTAHLWVLDIPASGWPQVVGELATTLVPGSTTGFFDVALDPSGSFAVLAAGSDGVWVVDVRRPALPVVAGVLDDTAWNSWAFGVALDAAGTRAYVADGGQGLKILSLTDPTRPTLIGSRALSGTQTDVAVSGSRAYVVNQSGAMRVLDVSSPAAIVWLGTGTLSGVGVRVAVEGTRVVALSASSPNAVLDVLDASNPSLPVRTASTVVGPMTDGKGVALSGGRAYVAAGSQGVRIYDAASAATPLLARLEDRFFGERMAAAGGLAVSVGRDTTTGYAHLQVLDLAVPDQPTVRAEIPTTIVPGSTTGLRDVVMSAARKLGVAAVGAEGIWVIDLANPAAPRIAGRFDTAGWALGVALDATGMRAYVADGNGGLKILDLTNPSLPSQIGSLALSGTQRDVAVAGNTVYLANQGGTLRVVDVSNPAAPRWTGSVSLSGFGYRVAVSGGRAAVISGDAVNDYLDVIDLSDPARARKVGTLRVAAAGGAGGVDLAGDRAMVAAGASGMMIVDLSNPASPSLLSSANGVGQALDVVLDGANALVTGFPSAVSVVGP